jgi:hypothetical protein
MKNDLFRLKYEWGQEAHMSEDMDFNQPKPANDKNHGLALAVTCVM